jgi:anti-sigma factor RsiW
MSKVTADVIHDLWPIYASGEASPDTRALVEEYLAGNPDLARALRSADGENPLVALCPPALPPDHERRTLDRVKQRLWGYPALFHLAMLFSALAFARIISDTSWDVSPRNFIISASIAAAFWIAFCLSLYRGRRKFLLIRLR